MEARAALAKEKAITPTIIKKMPNIYSMGLDGDISP